MPSAVIKPKKDQLTLDFTPGLLERYGSLRECVATGVYQRGLKRVAGYLDQASSNLSVQLSEDTSRNFSVDSLETYIEKSGDKTPILYLIARFLADEADHASVNRKRALRAKMAEMMEELDELGDA